MTEENNTTNTDTKNDHNKDYQESSPQQDQKESRFREGDIIKFVRVRFPGNSKSFPFHIGKRNFSYGQKVVAMSDRGMTVGYINSFPYEKNFNKEMMPIKSISKIASSEDIKQQKEFFQQEKEAENKCQSLILKYKLDMTLTHVEFMQFGKKAVFYFTAPQRVDFRDLVKDLVSQLKMRIELRQISVRDRAAAIGGIGVCGQQTCCSSFLNNYGNVSIKMAKNQNLALIPSKINGVCGQIKCCIKFEDKVYSEKRKFLPKEGTFTELLNGDRGKVQRLYVLEERFDLLTDRGKIKRYDGKLYDPQIKLPKDWDFPKNFDHIVNETNNIVKYDESFKNRREERSVLNKDVAEKTMTKIDHKNVSNGKNKQAKENLDKKSKQQQFKDKRGDHQRINDKQTANKNKPHHQKDHSIPGKSESQKENTPKLKTERKEKNNKYKSRYNKRNKKRSNQNNQNNKKD